MEHLINQAVRQEHMQGLQSCLAMIRVSFSEGAYASTKLAIADFFLSYRKAISYDPSIQEELKREVLLTHNLDDLAYRYLNGMNGMRGE